MRRLLLVIGLFTFSISLCYGQDGWKEETTNDGSVTVRSKITKQKDENEKEFQLVEYVVSTVAQVSFEKCIAVMRNVNLHTEFLNYTEVSQKVKDLSNNEWLIYYYFDAPWPMPNSDCVVQMKFEENAEKNKAIFEGEAKPDLYEMKDVARASLNDIRYEFTELEGGLVEIRITSKFSPTTMAPNWLANTYFPGGPTKMINEFIELTKS